MKYSLSPIDFKYVYNNSTSLLINDIRYYYISDNNPRLGFIVSRKYGNSVERNLFKRRCRYAFYQLIKKGVMHSIIIKPKTHNISWQIIKESFSTLHNELHS